MSPAQSGCVIRIRSAVRYGLCSAISKRSKSYFGSRKLSGYYIDERYGSAKDYEALLLNFELLNTIDADSAIKKYVLAEHRRAVILPDIAELLDAIENQHPVEFDYTLVRHGDKVVRKCLQSYFLKESQQRWYLIGYDVNGKLKSFGLDRLSSLQVRSRERFEHNETIIFLGQH